MAINFSEEAVHDYIHQQGMEALVVDFPQLQQEKSEYKPDDEFELWKLKVCMVLSVCVSHTKKHHGHIEVV